MMRIIPAIDLINGQAVRLTVGDFSQQKTYDASPVNVAKRFADHGFTHLHLVDLDGARARKPVNLPVLEAIASQTDLIIDYGGGIQTEEALTQAFSAGASQTTAGSIAVRQPELVAAWLERFGADKIIIGADYRDNTISINAWADQSDLTLAGFLADYAAKGAHTFICTDVSKDGKLQGPSLETYRHLKAQFPDLKLVASGGVTTTEDLDKLVQIGMEGAIIGKAIYEGTITLPDLKRFLC